MMESPHVALLLYHHALLILGCCLIMMLWAVGGEPYGVPRQLFLLFGVFSPMIQMFLGILLLFTPFQTNIFLLCPISFALIFFLSLGAQRRSREMKNRWWESEIKAAQQALLEGPDNAAAYLRKAELLDSAGMREEALKNYRTAHQLSPKTLSPYDFKRIEERLGPATRLKLAGKKEPGPRQLHFNLPDIRYGWLFCLLATAPVCYLDPRLFVGVFSVWLFALWCNAAQRDDL